MAGEDDAEHVVGLALVPVGDAPDALDAWARAASSRGRCTFSTKRVAVRVGEEVVDDLHARRRLLRVVDRGEAHQVVEGEVGVGLAEGGDLGDRVRRPPPPRAAAASASKAVILLAEALRPAARGCAAASIPTSCASGAIDAPARLPSGVALAAQHAVLLDLLLQLHHAVEQRLRPRRAAGHVDVHRHHLVDALQHVVAVLPVGAAVVGAGAHGDDVLGLRHLLVEPLHARGHLQGDGAGHDHEVALARRAARDHAEAVPVVAACRRSPSSRWRSRRGRRSSATGWTCAPS